MWDDCVNENGLNRPMSAATTPGSTIAVATDPMAHVVLGIGSHDFGSRLSTMLDDAIRPDIVGAYFIDRHRDMRVLFTGGGVPNIRDFPDLAGREYAQRYWKDDPAICRLMRDTLAQERSAVVRQRWDEIPSGEYRSFAYEHPGMLERVSLFRAFSEGSLILSVYRRAARGHFSSDEFGLVHGQADVLAAVMVRHFLSLRAAARLRPPVETLVGEIGGWHERLSPRETEACAALLREGSIKQAARALAMQPNTFITYRKRAYAKLAIRSDAELTQLYERRVHA
jgi:DNA-binding CsgD family transcriptional regulator